MNESLSQVLLEQIAARRPYPISVLYGYIRLAFRPFSSLFRQVFALIRLTSSGVLGWILSKPVTVCRTLPTTDVAFMDDDDIATCVLHCVARVSGPEEPTPQAALARVALVNRHLHQLARQNVIWKEVCRRRWAAYAQGETWLKEEEAAVEADPAVATWMTTFQRRERELVADWPVFCALAGFDHRRRIQFIASPSPTHPNPRCGDARLGPCTTDMGGSLNLAMPVGLHLFEPRYRRLIAEAMRTDRRFIFANNRPRTGETGYICECHNVQVISDSTPGVDRATTVLEPSGPRAPTRHFNLTRS